MLIEDGEKNDGYFAFQNFHFLKKRSTFHQIQYKGSLMICHMLDPKINVSCAETAAFIRRYAEYRADIQD